MGVLCEHGRADCDKSLGFSADLLPPLLRRAVTGDPQINVQPILRSLRLRDFEQGQPRGDPRWIDETGAADAIPDGLAERSQSFGSGGERCRGWLVDVADRGLPEGGHPLGVQAIEGQFHGGRHARMLSPHP